MVMSVVIKLRVVNSAGGLGHLREYVKHKNGTTRAGLRILNSLARILNGAEDRGVRVIPKVLLAWTYFGSTTQQPPLGRWQRFRQPSSTLRKSR
jgi:hypothetical protein